MKRFLLCLLILWIFNPLMFAQNNDSLSNLKVIGEEYKDYNIATYKQIPEDIAISFNGELKYFTKCINGYVAVLPITEKETESSNIILENHFNKKVNFKINPQSKWKFMIFMESSTGFVTSTTNYLHISQCANETELKKWRGNTLG